MNITHLLNKSYFYFKLNIVKGAVQFTIKKLKTIILKNEIYFLHAIYYNIKNVYFIFEFDCFEIFNCKLHSAIVKWLFFKAI